jgi:hypothetical protein
MDNPVKPTAHKTKENKTKTQYVYDTANKIVFLLLYAVCLGEKHHIPIVQSLAWTCYDNSCISLVL